MKHLMAMGLMALSACSTMPALSRDGMYYLDGIDNNDGMSAQISEKYGTLRVTGEVFTMPSCTSDSMPVCFTSDYLAFSYPINDQNSWRTADHEFARVGNVMFGNDRIEVIRSVQRHVIFYLYYNRQSGLIGWDVSYRGVTDGTPVTDRWRRLNFGSVRWPHADNSFKTNPLDSH